MQNRTLARGSRQHKPITTPDFAYSLFVDQYNKYGSAELEAVRRVIESGRLFRVIGEESRRLENRLAQEFDVAGCVLVSSGTAAVHVGLGATGVDHGDEVVTTPIADTGTVLPIFLQGAIPVFADVDPATMMPTAETIEAVLSPRTRTIIVVHYGGIPADMDPILELARSRNIDVIEDCAQAPASWHRDRRVGTLGTVGCFSVNDTKHVSCGDGGLVICRDPDVARRARIFSDKGFDRVTGLRDPEFVAPNYRITELQAAVLSTQWNTLTHRVAQRAAFAAMLDACLDSISWLTPVRVAAGNRGSFFSYLFQVACSAPIGRDTIAKALCAAGLPARPGNLYDCLYKLRIFHDALPRFMQHLPHPEYRNGMCPNAERVQALTVRIDMLETFSQADAETFANVIENLASSVTKA